MKRKSGKVSGFFTFLCICTNECFPVSLRFTDDQKEFLSRRSDDFEHDRGRSEKLPVCFSFLLRVYGINIYLFRLSKNNISVTDLSNQNRKPMNPIMTFEQAFKDYRKSLKFFLFLLWNGVFVFSCDFGTSSSSKFQGTVAGTIASLADRFERTRRDWNRSNGHRKNVGFLISYIRSSR